ncbi:kinase-like domain-containing protein [Rhizophagus irregularis DAOM 181602=DAOM 197198]|nr:kinase-like domain-containing protein [Rhizophagus irregularis DAOM 181602=DAOM 197198]
MDKGNETQVIIETEFTNLNISDKDSSTINISHKNCSYCNKPFTEELWCKKCDPFRMIEGWTSGNNDLDKFIKDTIYDARNKTYEYDRFLEWVPFDKFKNVKQIGIGGFAKVFSATWIDGKAEYDYGWKRKEPRPINVALKRLNGSQNMSAEYLNELKIQWDFYKSTDIDLLKFYGMTKDPETEEFMMILQFANKGNLRRKEIEALFEEADKEIPNISTSYEKNPDAIYTSRLFTLTNLTKPVNSSLITSYLDDEENSKDCQDSQLFDLEVSSSLQLKDDSNEDDIKN